MDPAVIDSGDIFTSSDGNVCVGGVAGRVASKGDVIGLEDGVVGNPFALHDVGGIVLG